MRNIEVDSLTTLSHILSELKTTDEDGLELTVVPGEKSLFDNPINKKIIEKVAKEQKKEVVFPAVPIEAVPEAESDDMGFVEGEDVVAKAPIEDVHKMIQPAATAASVGKNPPSTNKLLNKLAKNKLVWVAGAAVLLLILLGSAIFVLPSSEVTITAKTEDKETQLTLNGDPSAKEFTLEGSVVPYQTSEVSKEGTEEQATTGKKTIGNPAKGRVTITNQDTTSPKTFVAGTILTYVTNANITFKLDSEVSVEQAPIGGEKTAGVNVTAIKAGTEGNLPEGSVFKVGSSDPTFVFARNDVAFSGGSSKLANVASTEDRESLKNKLIENLEEDAKKEIEEKQKDVVVVEDSFEVKVTKETYEPKAVDAEAENLKATLSITAKAAYVDKEGLKKLVVETLSKTSGNASVDPEDIEISLQQTDKDQSGKITLIAKVNAKLVPDMDESEIKRNLSGKSVAQAGAYLDSLEEVAGYKVSTSPFYFRFLGRLPFSASKITLKFED